MRLRGGGGGGGGVRGKATGKWIGRRRTCQRRPAGCGGGGGGKKTLKLSNYGVEPVPSPH